MPKFQVIFTFYQHEQEVLDFTVYKELNEEEFLYTLFDTFSNELDLLKDLCKLSCCQFVNKKEDAYGYILRRNGKYYFNPEVNQDDDTKNLRKMLNDYIRAVSGNLDDDIRDLRKVFDEYKEGVPD